MAFRGQHEHNIDSKDRVTVPAAYRVDFSEGVVLLAGLDPCVEIYTEEGAAQFESRFLDGLNPLGSEARDMQRRFYSMSTSTELDSAGRVRLPKQLIEHAELSGPCMVVGVGNRLELWSPERWAPTKQNFQGRAHEIAEGMAAGDGSGAA